MKGKHFIILNFFFHAFVLFCSSFVLTDAMVENENVTLKIIPTPNPQFRIASQK